MRLSRSEMETGDYDMGFVFDGDGDRLDTLLPSGDQLSPSLNFSLLLPYLKKEGWTDVYADVKALPPALVEMASCGMRPHMVKNGHSYIKDKLLKNSDAGFFAGVEESSHYYMLFPYKEVDGTTGYAATENTLFFSLMTLKVLRKDPSAFHRVSKLESSVSRHREWSLHFAKSPEKMTVLLQRVEERMKAEGAIVIKEMEDGTDLEATLMRFNLPLTFSVGTSLDNRPWAQVAQRISRSEDALCRWEVTASDKEECRRLVGIIEELASSYADESTVLH